MRIPLLLLLLVAVSGCDRMDWAPVAPLVAVKTKGKFGYTNREGTLVIAAQFDDAFEFHDGIARVMQGAAADRRVVFRLHLLSIFKAGRQHAPGQV